MPDLSALLDRLPEGNAGLAIKIAVGLVGAIWWTSGKGADEERYFSLDQLAFAEYAMDWFSPVVAVCTPFNELVDDY